MEYDFREIEKKWRKKWLEEGAYTVRNPEPAQDPAAPSRPKCYVLDMFPYPSGTGLHVGHPLGYIASDIYARFKRLKGFHVLHPMGFDAFGLPAEQYALTHGVHPADSTDQNIRNFRDQLDNLGLSFDWSRELRTSDPEFYRWTQWIFLQLFDSWYNRKTARAEPMSELVEIFERRGNLDHPMPNGQFQLPLTGKDSPIGSSFSAAHWAGFSDKTRSGILMEYRLAYCGFGEVNWCEALGTVLANDEVIGGFSERGGYPVVKKKLRQWYLRITEYADRLLEGLQQVDFSESMKEMQSNWIGRSFGAEIDFQVENPENLKLRVYTTRPDTIFGADFMVIAPEHELLHKITRQDQRAAVGRYLEYMQSRNERERMAEKKISGCFTGGYATHPFDGRQIPIWVSEYVLAGYGTGAIMAVPCGDERDFRFAVHFGIPITNIIGPAFSGEQANPTKEARLENSGFLNGMIMRDAIEVVIRSLEEKGIGIRKVNYKMRDAAFSRQRYWGEPIPVIWENGKAIPMDAAELPLKLPRLDNYTPGPEGEGPLANIPAWAAAHRETNTMPGYAGSSWYFLRYMDPHNRETFCSREASDYWGQVDLYVGGSEHAVGHLLYSRMWTKALYDLGHIGFDEPFRKLLNQGMIQGSSRFVYKLQWVDRPEMEEASRQKPLFISEGVKNLAENEWNDLLKKEAAVTYPGIYHPGYPFAIQQLRVDVNIVDGFLLDIDAFRSWRPEYAQAVMICENGSRSVPGKPSSGDYICGAEVEKMGKSKFNTVNPNDLVNKFGADTFRLYEMFLGPLEQSKPWDSKGIEGVHRFLKKLWRLFYDESRGRIWNQEGPGAEELRVLHRTLRKVEEDTERFSFNTAVSAFMIAVNELTDLKCHKTQVLGPLLVTLTPYAPHVCAELWARLGQSGSILDAQYPRWEEQWIVETSKKYPVAINGRTRTELQIDIDATPEQVEEMVLASALVQKWLEGKKIKKLIYVKGKMINVVV